jgi:hypothetical protein
MKLNIIRTFPRYLDVQEVPKDNYTAIFINVARIAASRHSLINDYPNPSAFLVKKDDGSYHLVWYGKNNELMQRPCRDDIDDFEAGLDFYKDVL